MPTIAIDIDKARLRDFCRKWKITEFALFAFFGRPVDLVERKIAEQSTNRYRKRSILIRRCCSMLPECDLRKQFSQFPCIASTACGTCSSTNTPATTSTIF